MNCNQCQQMTADRSDCPTPCMSELDVDMECAFFEMRQLERPMEEADDE